MAASGRFVFAAHGTWGDVGPLVSVALALVARGAQVIFISTPYFEEGLRRRGLKQVRIVGTWWDPQEALSDPRLRHPLKAPAYIWREVFEPLLLPMWDEVSRALEELGGGVVVLHPWCIGAQLAAQEARLAWCMVALAPITWFSAEDVPVTGPWRAPKLLAKPLMRWPVRGLMRRVLGGDIAKTVRARGGQPLADPFFGATHEAALNLAFWPALFRAPAADDPPRVKLCGFFGSASEEPALDGALEAFLADGEPPVIMGLGSALPALAGELYTRVEQVCLALGLRVVLVGAPEAAPRPGSLRVAWAPYSALFKRARLLVHHGGVGSVAEALRAGRPQLIIPFGADQYDNAARLSEVLAVGVVLPEPMASLGAIEASLRALLDRERDLLARAQQLAEQLRAQPDGAAEAASALLALDDASSSLS